MGRAPCCDKQGLKRGPWTPEEDKILVDHIQANGYGSWRSLPRLAGLSRCGKSCRLRWTNYLRPDIKRGPFTPEEQQSIIQLHGIIGNKWSTIAAHLPGRTDNEVKNYWNTHLKKRLLRMGLDPDTYTPSASPSSPNATPSTRHMTQWESARLEAEARLSRQSLLFSTTTATATANTSSSSTENSSAANQSDPSPLKPDPEPVDLFLRMWNSPIGDAFRKPVTAASNATVTEPSPVQSSNVSSSNEAEETSAAEEEEEDTYRLYLNFAAGDDIGFFQGGGCYSSLFSADLNEASLDTAFK